MWPVRFKIGFWSSWDAMLSNLSAFLRYLHHVHIQQGSNFVIVIQAFDSHQFHSMLQVNEYPDMMVKTVKPFRNLRSLLSTCYYVCFVSVITGSSTSNTRAVS